MELEEFKNSAAQAWRDRDVLSKKLAALQGSAAQRHGEQK
jgi:hypothetical protein